MNTKQLYYALVHNAVTRKCFDGIYARDTLVDIQSTPELVICNTDYSNATGEHWILFHFKKPGHLIFYDSLGHDFAHYGKEFVTFVQRWATTFEHVAHRTQPLDSNLCGVYCLYFAYYTCKYWTRAKIIKSMTSSRKVVSVVNKLYTLCEPSQCPFLQCCVKL